MKIRHQTHFVIAGFRWFQVVPCFSNYGKFTESLEKKKTWCSKGKAGVETQSINIFHFMLYYRISTNYS